MRTLIFLLCWIGTAAQAHEVHHRIAATEAVVIALSYANGQPFAYEKYALTPAGQNAPMQVGNTDAQGRIVFVPGATAKWRLTATSADGHGVVFEFDVPTITSSADEADGAKTPRWLLAGFGLSLIFGLFGLFQLFMRKAP